MIVSTPHRVLLDLGAVAAAEILIRSMSPRAPSVALTRSDLGEHDVDVWPEFE